ncbi:hypothetical protein F5I97DRAFT_1798635 [Phlebopus sp. FC_14]|nr:hypothetical protein F5I97DRAFT_1798635 [Phlebopus sp. FC_14]
MISLAAFPEELLVRILALCVAPPPVLPPRPTWDTIPPPNSVPFSPSIRSLPPRNRLAPLFVSRQFLRIASPLFYHTLHLQSALQTRRALQTLDRNPSLANAVRKVIFDGIWAECAMLLVLCTRVDNVDMCLDSGPGHHPGSPRPLHGGLHARNSFGDDDGFSDRLLSNGDADIEAEAFCAALAKRDVVHLTIRKHHAAYLTHPRSQYVLERMAQIVQAWRRLETVHLALRISASPVTLVFAQALSSSPRLHTIRAQLPAVWNTLLLVISSNPALDKIMLYSEPMFGYAVLGTGLYMLEARKHARLSDLIKAGTSIIRTRAHTTIATVSSQAPTATPLGASRAKQVTVELLAGR